MAEVTIIKKNGTYIEPELINGQTILEESNIRPLVVSTKENSERIVNGVITLELDKSLFTAFTDSEGYTQYKCVINHSYNTKWINVSSYYMETSGRLIEAFVTVNVNSASQFEIINDEQATLTAVVVFDLI